ncbi:hypothetical protein ACFLRM_00760 [Acidobacteriota bacterium]
MGGMRAETWLDVSKTCRLCPSGLKPAQFQASLSSPSWRGTMPALPSNGFLYRPTRSLLLFVVY